MKSWRVYDFEAHEFWDYESDSFSETLKRVKKEAKKTHGWFSIDLFIDGVFEETIITIDERI